MTVIQASIFNVLDRFPDRKDTIRKLFKENEAFQVICDDYRKCARALGRWDQSTLPEAPARRKEYADFLHELEVEILQYLNGVI